MNPEDYVRLDATALAELVGRGELSPVEIARAAIERIDALNDALNAVVERSDDAALQAAAQTDRAAPLAGVPFLAKDMNIEVAGLHLTASCPWLADLPAATVDAPLAARWRRAGLTILGRTNTPEFAGEFVTEPTARGATLNPWDVQRSPGGSSGGAAAAVASGMVPMAHGTDSGGSIRVPASACGLVGLKPSRGWVPGGPNLDELCGGLDCEHVLTRTVRDSALMLDLTQGEEAGTRVPLRRPAESFSYAVGRHVPTLRIGVALPAADGLLPEAEIAQAVEETARLLARAGHQLHGFDYPSSAHIGSSAAIVWMTAIAEEIAYWRTHVGRPPGRHELEALSRASIEVADRCTAVEYVGARRRLGIAARDMALAFQNIDLLLLPTTATLPPRVGAIDGRTDAFDLNDWSTQSYHFAPYTELFNATGQPAISLPLAESRSGLPIGVQLVAALGEDALLLSVAAWIERECPWHERGLALRQRLLRAPPVRTQSLSQRG